MSNAPQIYQHTKAYKNMLNHTGLQNGKVPNQVAPSPQVADSLPIVNQLGSDSLRVNYQHFTTPTITSKRAQPSILMSATKNSINAMMSVTLEPPRTETETVVKKDKGSAQQRMIKLMKK